jgi:hypothetical protein
VDQMDERIESFLADVMALVGEDENAIREGVRGALADYEQIFRVQEVNKRMKDKAAHDFTSSAALAWSRKSSDGREHQPQTT